MSRDYENPIICKTNQSWIKYIFKKRKKKWLLGFNRKKKGLFENKDENGEGGIEKKDSNISNKKFDFPSIGNLAEEAIHTTELIIALFYFRHFESFRILYWLMIKNR
jgi:hypothetical protein